MPKPFNVLEDLELKSLPCSTNATVQVLLGQVSFTHHRPRIHISYASRPTSRSPPYVALNCIPFPDRPLLLFRL
jgi:hypothetical protein